MERIVSILEFDAIVPEDEIFSKYQNTDFSYAVHPLIAGQRSGEL